jgi:adenosylmethionine-8-amino-7-oxononanoate aminotransferase
MTDSDNKLSRLIARDLAVLWHPCTQMKDHEREMPLIPIRSGRGVWLEGMDGHHYLDAISSWWVNLFGHTNPTIIRLSQNSLIGLNM